MLVEMLVADLSTDPCSGMPVLRLRETQGERMLTLGIGMSEACSIAVVLDGIQLERPTAHDLLRQAVVALGGTIVAAEIDSLRGKAYGATLRVKRGEEEHCFEARPSDAIAVALRCGCPIRAAVSLLATPETTPHDLLEVIAAPAATREERPCARRALSSETCCQDLEVLPDEAFGKWKM